MTDQPDLATLINQAIDNNDTRIAQLIELREQVNSAIADVNHQSRQLLEALQRFNESGEDEADFWKRC